MEWIKPELLVLVGALFVLGTGLKRSQMKDRYIPLILGGAGILAAALYVCATTSLEGAQDVMLALFSGLTQGLLCAGGSVYIHQLCKQAGKEKGL